MLQKPGFSGDVEDAEKTDVEHARLTSILEDLVEGEETVALRETCGKTKSRVKPNS